MEKKFNASLRGFAAAFAAVCVVFASVVFASCQAGEEDDWTPTPMASVAVLTNNVLVSNGKNIAFIGMDQKLSYIAMPAAQQGAPALTSQSNPENVNDVRTETRFGYSDTQLLTSYVEGIGGEQVSASFMPKNIEAEKVNDHMTKVNASFDVSGFWVNREFGQDITVPFNGVISKQWIQADETVKTDTTVQVLHETDSIVTYVNNYIYVTDTMRVVTVVHDSLFFEKHDTTVIVQDRVIEKVVEVPVTVEVPVEVLVHDSIYFAVHDTITEIKTEKVLEYIEKYLDKSLNRHSYLGGAWATLELDGKKLLEFNLGLMYQVVEVEKNIWGSNKMTNQVKNQFYYNDTEVATYSVVTDGANVESVEYVKTSFSNTELGEYKLGKMEFVVKGTYTGINGATENFEFTLNPYYLQAVKPEAVVKSDVYTYEFSWEDVEGTPAGQLQKTFSVTRYLNGNVDKSWSYKAWIAKIGPVSGTHLHVSEASVLSENLTNGTSSTKWEEECGEKKLTGKNLGFVANTDCRLYDYEVAFPSTAGGKVEAKSQIAYWVKEISFYDPERPDDENGHHTWTMGEQATNVTAHAIKNDSSAEKTFTFSEGASQVTASYVGSYILTLDHQIGGKSWYSQTASTHLYK